MSETVTCRCRELEIEIEHLKLELAETKAVLKTEQIARKRFEESYQIAEQRFEVLLEHSPFSLLLYDLDSRPTKISTYCEETWGFKLDELPPDYCLFNDLQLEKLGAMPAIHRAFKGEIALLPSIKYNMRKNGVLTGQERWTQGFMYPVKSQDGNLREVVLIHKDIHDYKETEIAWLQELERARRAEKRFQTLFEQSPIGVQVFAPDGYCTEINPAIREMWNITEEMNFTTFNVLHDSQNEKLDRTALLQKVFFEKQAVELPLGFYQGSINFPNSKDLWVKANIFPILDENANLDEVMVIHQNVTALKQAEKELREAQIAVVEEREKAAQEWANQLAKANEVLRRTLDSLATQPDINTFLKRVMCEITEQTKAATCLFLLYDEAINTLHMQMAVNKGDIVDPTDLGIDRIDNNSVYPADATPAWQMLVEKREPVLFDFVKDYQTGNTPMYWPGTLEWHLEQGYTHELSSALLLGERPLGMLCLIFTSPPSYSLEQMELIKALTQQATLALELNRLAEKERQVARLAEKIAQAQTETLLKPLSVLATNPVIDNFLGHVLAAITEQVGVNWGSIYLYQEEYATTVFYIEYNNGIVRKGAEAFYPDAGQVPYREWDDAFLPLLKENQILVHTEKDFANPAVARYRDYITEREVKKVLIIPLFFGTEFLGTLFLESQDANAFGEEAVKLAQVLTHQITMALELTRLAEKEREEAQQGAILEERNRMAREIHDTIAQGLTGIVVQLQAANINTLTNEDRLYHIETARQLAKECLAEARRSVWALRPLVLEEADLSSAFAHLVDKVSTSNGPAIYYSVYGLPYHLPLELENNLLRIGQEALTNALKHSGATTINIELTFQPAGITLVVKDNGCGFNPEFTAGKGFGLTGMQERARLSGLELNITSQPKLGCLIRANINILSAKL